VLNGPAWVQAATAAAVTFALLMFAILFYRRLQERRGPPPEVEVHVTPYIRKAVFLAPAEQRFYFRLVQAVGNDFLICPKVRLADIIEVRGDAMEWRGSWNRIAAKHIDFLLTNTDTFQPVLALDLADDTHYGDQQMRQDEWLDRALEAARMPVLRVKVRRDYDAAALRKQIDQRIANG